MARKRRAGAVYDLVRAGLVVFAGSGFRDAQMVDVAREMGVALGTVYSYVESKEALFGLVIDRVGTTDYEADIALPVRTPPIDELLERTRGRIEGLTRLPVLAAAQRRRRPADPREELYGVLEEFWDLTLTTRLAADMIERSARDWPQLADLFYDQIRRDLFDRLQSYVARRVRGEQFRVDGDPRVIARTMVETVTFWARHRYGDRDVAGVADADVRPIVLAFLVDAVAGAEPGAPLDRAGSVRRDAGGQVPPTSTVRSEGSR